MFSLHIVFHPSCKSHVQLGTYFRAEFMSRLRNPYLQCSDFTDSHKELMFAHLAATFQFPFAITYIELCQQKGFAKRKNWLRSPALILPFFGTPLLRVRAGLGFGLD